MTATPAQEGAAPVGPLISIVTPCFEEADNLPLLHERLRAVMDGLGQPWEWIVVDDHSGDGSFEVLAGLANADARVRGLRLARNVGAHLAIACGIEQAAGACCAVLAADLQDPPETLPALLERWRAGAQVVWAARAGRAGESTQTLLAARTYYWLMRHLVGLREMPPGGADVMLLDRAVMDALARFGERNVSIHALIAWMGFRQERIDYEKQARLHGRSGWSLGKKLKLLVDSVTAFSDLPVRLMTCLGLAVTLLGFLYAAVLFVEALLGAPIEGWTVLMVAVLVIGGLQMTMLGVLGAYLWRALDESRGRPRYLIEARIGAEPPAERAAPPGP